MPSAFLDSAHAFHQRSRWCLVQLLFTSLIVVAIPITGFAQTTSIKMTFGDQETARPQPERSRLVDYRESVSDPLKRVVLASATFIINQESDFEPVPQVQPERDLQTLNLPGMTEPRSVLQNVQEPDTQNPDPLNVRETDEPIDQPNLNLNEPLPPNTYRAPKPKLASPTQTPDEPSDISLNDERSNRDYALPSIASVREPISMMPLGGIGQSDPSGLLSQDQDFSLNQRSVGRETSYADLSGTPAQAKSKTWKPHNFYHRPLYFEEPNVERQGNRRAFQNVVSPIHFFGTIPKLPSLIIEARPHQRVYTHGNGRPGDYTDYRIVRPSHHRKGQAFETLVTLGVYLP